MMWLIWRQHRTEVCVLGLLVGIFGLALFALGTQAHDLFPGGPARCAGQADINAACTASFRRLDEEYGYVENLLAAFYRARPPGRPGRRARTRTRTGRPPGRRAAAAGPCAGRASARRGRRPGIRSAPAAASAGRCVRR